MRITKATVSRSIARLEEELKAPLFRRITRIVELTPLGQRLFTACFSELVTLNERMRAALSDEDQPSRLIRITAVEDLGTHLIPKVVSKCSKRYPHIRFELLLTNEHPETDVYFIGSFKTEGTLNASLARRVGGNNAHHL